MRLPILPRRLAVLAGPALCAASLAVATIAPAAAASPPRSGPPVGPIEIGGNPPGIFDWSRTHEFSDLVKQSRQFGPPATPWDGGIPVDANGWPTEDFGVILFVSQEGISGHGGTYAVSFECAVLPSVSAPGFNSGVGIFTRDPGTGVCSGTVTLPADPGSFFMQFTGTSGGVRNLKVIRPGYTPADTFTTPFIQHMQRFKIVRVMDWTHTNDSPQVTWADRPTLQSAQYSETGVPYETCIDLCNLIDADIWVCVPHMADDNYVQQLATLLQTRLEPARKIYVEYSNEVWNPLFTQFNYNFDRAQIESQQPGNPLNYDNNGDGRILTQRRVAKRTLEIGNIFQSVFGASARDTRFRTIFGARCWSPDEPREGLRMIADRYGPPKNYFYGFSTAPYIYIDFGNDVPNLTPQGVIQYLQTDADNMETNANMEQMGALAYWYGIRYMASEAGTDTTGFNSLESKRLANYDPAIGPVVEQYLNTFFAWGFGPMVWYVSGAVSWSSPYGTTFGLTEDMSNQTVPKIVALDQVASGPLPAPRGGVLLPAVLDARLHAFRRSGFESLPYYPMSPNDTQADYLVRVDGTVARPFAIFPRVSSYVGATLRLSVDGAPVRTVTTPGVNSDTAFAETAPAILTLQPGHHVVRVDFVSGIDANVQTIRIACPGDANDDGLRTPADIFFFLNLYFSGSARTDVNADGLRTPADIFAFLNTYFAGC